MASLRISHKVVALIRRVLSQSEIFLFEVTFMLFVGIDIGKNNHVASMMDEYGKVVFKAFSFSNTTDGGNALFSKLSSYSSNPSDFEIGMEATGHYWLSVYSFLFEKGFLLHVINPIQTDGWRKGTEIRKRKTIPLILF